MPVQAGIFFVRWSMMPPSTLRGGAIMRKRMFVLGIAAVLACTLPGAGSAGATEFCSIRKMPDGFLALREQPNAKGKLLARMKPGDEVMINNIVAEKNGWTRVYWFKDGRFRGETARGIESADKQGWVNSRLLGDECG
jgi:hypothetical protein